MPLPRQPGCISLSQNLTMVQSASMLLSRTEPLLEAEIVMFTALVKATKGTPWEHLHGLLWNARTRYPRDPMNEIFSDQLYSLLLSYLS